MRSERFTVDEIELAGGSIVGSASGTFEFDEFDYEPSSVEIESAVLYLNDEHKVDLSAEQRSELESLVCAALAGVEFGTGRVVVSAVSVSH